MIISVSLYIVLLHFLLPITSHRYIFLFREFSLRLSCFQLSRLVTQKQTVGKMEEELGRQLEERTRLVDEITTLVSTMLSL